MRTISKINTILYVVIAVFLGIIAVRSLTIKPVEAGGGNQTIDVNIVEIGGSSLSVRHLRGLPRDRR